MLPMAAGPGWKGTLACATGAMTWRRGGPPGLGSRTTGRRRVLRQRLAGRLFGTQAEFLDQANLHILSGGMWAGCDATRDAHVHDQVNDPAHADFWDQANNSAHVDFLDQAHLHDHSGGLRAGCDATRDAHELDQVNDPAHADFLDDANDDWLEESEALLGARLQAGGHGTCTWRELNHMAEIFDLFDGSTPEELLGAFSDEGGLAFCDTEDDLLILVPFLLRAATTSLQSLPSVVASD